MKTIRAFTLIELLIVVAIIAILAAIAVPNFLEAQVRSKVSRVKSDLRSVVTALEAYAVDQNDYPHMDTEGNHHWLQYVHELTSPIAYISSLTLVDPFNPSAKILVDAENRNLPNYKGSYGYYNYNCAFFAEYYPPETRVKGGVVNSFGPDNINNGSSYIVPYYILPGPVSSAPPPVGYGSYPAPGWVYMLYDSTNGAKSGGDIVKLFGACPGPPTN